ncbi:nitrate reductase cytochrome c-type subunit [Chloroflexota bacterium]
MLTIGELIINEYTDKVPGQSIKLPRAYPGAPPFIPHSLSELVINNSTNSCFLCHITGLSYGPDHTATIIPESHYTDIFTGTLSEEIQGLRYNCLLCHVPQSPENPPLE